MPRFEGWGFLSLIGCLTTVALSMTLLEGNWQAVGCGIGALLGILSGGIYALSAHPESHEPTSRSRY